MIKSYKHSCIALLLVYIIFVLVKCIFIQSKAIHVILLTFCVMLLKDEARILYLTNKLILEFQICVSYRSEGTSTSEHRRNRRRSMSITPEIGDDIVRLIFSNF